MSGPSAHEGTILAGMDAIRQILQGIDLDTSMHILGAVTTVTIVNQTANENEAEKYADRFIDAFAGTLSEMLDAKGGEHHADK